MLSLGNKLSLTTQPIYKFVNKYSIDFDGVDDRIITDGADTVLQNTTYSFWCKSSTTGVNNGVFGHGLDRTGAFHFNRNADRPQLFLGTNYLVIWNDTSAQDDGEWHHWVVYSDPNDITNSKLYVDGVLQSQSFVNSSGSANAYTESLTIGSDQQVGGNSFEGKIDEFAVYDRELTQAEITRMYNTYYSPNRIANGNFAQEGVEEVTNGDFSQIGSELVTNGDFATDSDWTKGVGTTIESGLLNFANASSNTDQSLATTNAKIYKVVYVISNYSAGSIRFRFTGTANVNGTVRSANGTYTEYIKATSSNSIFRFAASAFTGSIDNVSVKEVGQDWELFGVAAIDGNAIDLIDDGSNTYSGVRQDVASFVGKQYKIKITVTNWVQGSVLAVFGSNNTDFNVTGDGDYTAYLSPSSTGNDIEISRDFSTGANFSYSISNISVKEVGQHWTFGNVGGNNGWRITDTNAICDTNAAIANRNITSNFSLVSGKDYKLTIDILQSADNMQVLVGSTTLSATLPTGTNLAYEYTISGADHTGGVLAFYAGTSDLQEIDNIVLQELKHDATNLMLNAGAYQSANPLITSTKSMEFDGTDEFLSTQFIPNKNEGSFSFWFKIHTLKDFNTLFENSVDANDWECWSDSSGNLKFRTDNADIYLQSTSVISANIWYNGVITYTENDGGVLYLNGVQIATSTSTFASRPTPQEMSIGGGLLNTDLDGLITEFGTWDRTLTALEVASLYNQGMPTNLLVNRNNYQSGNPTVFNTKQVDFDGTDDYLEIGSALDFNAKDFSVSAWYKTTDTEFRVIQTRNTGAAGAKAGWQISTLSGSNWDNTLIEDTSGNHLSFTNSTMTNLNDGNWHHIVITWETSAGTGRLYVDGFLLDTQTNASMINSNINSTNSLIIGGANSGSQMLNGEISQSGIWHSVLTADEVSSLYNHGLPIDLTTNQAAYASSSNLLGYWRMGSGTLDSYPLIADQTNATLGSEEVTNGDFATDSDWTNEISGWTISNGKANYSGVNPVASFQQNISLSAGKIYKVTYTISNRQQGDFRILLGNTAGTINNSDGTYTEYITYSSGSLFYLQARSSFIGSIDNVSVKQVQGNPAIMKNQTSSDIENGSPYAQLITDSNFPTGTTAWEKGSNTIIGNGEASFNGVSSFVYQNVLTIGNTYKASVTVKNWTSGVALSAGSSATGGGTQYSEITKTSNTTTEFTFTATSETLGIGSRSFNVVGSLSSVTVEEVNTGLQGYWKMGDGTNDKYPVIYDQTNPTLGVELVTNGDGSSTTGWSLAYPNTTLSINNNHLRATANASGAYGLSQSLSLDTSKEYIIKATINVDNASGGAGNLRFATNSNLSSGVTTLSSATGTSTTILSPSAATMYIGIVDTANDSSNYVEIDNISVKEISGNPATMTNMVEGNITNQYPLTKIRNYYRMGDGILDSYPIIQDQTSPNLAHIPTTNLVNYSEDFTNAIYQKIRSSVTANQIISPDGTQNADKFIEDSSNDTHLLWTQDITVTVGDVITWSVYAKKGERSWIFLRDTQAGSFTGLFDLENGVTGNKIGSLASNIVDAGNGWYRCSITYTSTTTTARGRIYIATDDNTNPYQGNGTSGVYIWGSQLELQNQATAYIKSDGIAAVRKATTTNLVTYSEDTSQWTDSGITYSVDYIISPDGTLNASKAIINDTITSSNTRPMTSVAVTSGTNYVFSVFGKADEFDMINLDFSNTAFSTVSVVYNLTNGTVTSFVGSPVSQGVEDYGNGWYRCYVVATAIATTTTALIIRLDDNPTGDGTSGLYLWGAQAEQQTQVETYAKTTGLPVTIDLFTENNYGTMTNMSASDIIEDTP